MNLEPLTVQIKQ